MHYLDSKKKIVFKILKTMNLKIFKFNEFVDFFFVSPGLKHLFKHKIINQNIWILMAKGDISNFFYSLNGFDLILEIQF